VPSTDGYNFSIFLQVSLGDSSLPKLEVGVIVSVLACDYDL
jgi:hypothetical protein